MKFLRRTSPKYREDLWDACAHPTTGFVFCNLCGGRVLPTEPWAESHLGAPKALGGIAVGIAHKRCNELDNNKFVTPFVAKTKRMRRKHIGADRPGLGKNALPGGRGSKWKKKITGEVVLRYPEGQA